MLRQSFSEHKDEPLLANAAGDDGAAANEFDDEASPVASRSSRCQLGKSICRKVTLGFHYEEMALNVPQSQLKDRLVTEWTTIGIVAALMGSFAFQAFSTIPQTLQTKTISVNQITNQTLSLQVVYGTLTAYAFGCNICAILLSVWYFAMLAMLPDERVLKFVRAFSHLLGGPMIFLFNGQIFLVVAVVLMAYGSYDYPLWVIVGVGDVVVAGIVFLVAVYMYAKTNSINADAVARR
jgi:hypothetical protein